jgi:hypothetical protein
VNERMPSDDELEAMILGPLPEKSSLPEELWSAAWSPHQSAQTNGNERGQDDAMQRILDLQDTYPELKDRF